MVQIPGDFLHNWKDLDWHEIGNGLKMAYLLHKQMPGGIIFCVDRPPHNRTPAHSHPLPHIEILLEGSIDLGSGRVMKQGDFRVVDGGVAYGPLVAGPEGAKCIEISPHLDDHFKSTVTEDLSAYDFDWDSLTKNMMALYHRAKADLET